MNSSRFGAATTAWLERFEPVLRVIFRLAVLVLLLLCWWKLDELPRYSPDLRTIEQDVDRIQRDVARLKDRLAP